MRKLLILDCDGVLYPASNLSHADFICAFNKAREKYKGKRLYVAEENLKNAADFWNEIRKMCDISNCSFDDFCKMMIDNINYKKIRKSRVLLSLLNTTKEKFDIAVLSDNHYYHLEQILSHRFNLGIKDFSAMGIDCFDITSSECNGRFFPKCNEVALSNFLKKQKRKAKDCIFVDNNKSNISAGRSIGMKSIYICRKRSLQNYLRQLNGENYI